jgi:hypothetical protein
VGEQRAKVAKVEKSRKMTKNGQNRNFSRKKFRCQVPKTSGSTQSWDFCLPQASGGAICVIRKDFPAQNALYQQVPAVFGRNFRNILSKFPSF